MNTQPQRNKVDDTTGTNDSKDISWYKGKLLKLVILTNLFETQYPRLWSCQSHNIIVDFCVLKEKGNTSLKN